MDGHHSFRDFLSQAGSSSAPRNLTIPIHKVAEDNEFGLFSPTHLIHSSSMNNSAPRIRMDQLDLNHQGTEFPHFSLYQQVLETGEPTNNLGFPDSCIRIGCTPFQTTRSTTGGMRGRGNPPLVRGRDASRGISRGRGRFRGFRGSGGISVPVEHLEDEAETESEARLAVVRHYFISVICSSQFLYVYSFSCYNLFYCYMLYLTNNDT
jgi:hypothetical protein